MTHAPYIRHVAGGKKAILFLHGFLGSPRHFDMFIPFIPEDVAVYNLLLEGHGGDVLSFGRTSMRAWKKQVGSAANELILRYGELYIVAHSMGTLFAMDIALRYPGHVKGLFLFASPLKIAVGLFAVKNSIKSMFRRVNPDDEIGKAYANAHSVALNLKLWEYITWIPRYLELFAESKRGRHTILNLSVPCRIYQSGKDELVSAKASRYIPKKKNIWLKILPNSNHFIYAKEDKAFLLSEWKQVLADF